METFVNSVCRKLDRSIPKSIPEIDASQHKADGGNQMIDFRNNQKPMKGLAMQPQIVAANMPGDKQYKQTAEEARLAEEELCMTACALENISGLFTSLSLIADIMLPSQEKLAVQGIAHIGNSFCKNWVDRLQQIEDSFKPNVQVR